MRGLVAYLAAGGSLKGVGGRQIGWRLAAVTGERSICFPVGVKGGND